MEVDGEQILGEGQKITSVCVAPGVPHFDDGSALAQVQPVYPCVTFDRAICETVPDSLPFLGGSDV